MKSKNGSKGGKMGGKKNTGYRNRGKTEVGKEAKVQSYKEYVQKMFGGGMTGPAMKKNKTKGMRAGGKTKTKGARAGGMMGVSRAPSMPTGPSMIKAKKSVRPDPRLPKGKKGKGDI
jgi:hypothetical protein